MFTNWYKVVGITEEMYKEWQGELREDLITWKDGDGLHFRVRLGILESFLLRCQLRNWSSRNIGCLRLIKLRANEA